MRDVLVKDIMSSPIIAVDVDTNVTETANMLIMKKTGSVLVSDGSKYKGIITKKDIVRMVAEGGNPSEVKAKDIMSSPMKTVDSRATVVQVVRMMSREKLKRLVVMDGNKQIGVVSYQDVVNVASDIIDVLKEHVKMEGK